LGIGWEEGLGLAVEGLVKVGRVAFDEALAANRMVGVVLVNATRAENSAVNAPTVALVRDEERSGLVSVTGTHLKLSPASRIRFTHEENII
jgi:hypothetical protein